MLYSVRSSFWTAARKISGYGWISTQLGPPAKRNIASVQGRHYLAFGAIIFYLANKTAPVANGLAGWTSNSKVVGSSPTGGGTFTLQT